MNMKIPVMNVDNVKSAEIELPMQFSEPVDADLIRRAVEALQAARRQPYGSLPVAGKRASAKISRRRHSYKTSYGRGISRVPRKIMSRSGSQFNFEGAFAPGMVGGRRAHPPKSARVWAKKINKKERQKAIRSALAATIARDVVRKKHNVPPAYPFALDDSFEKLAKTKEVVAALAKIGMGTELARTSEKTKRAGKGKRRGRPYRTKKGLLIVVSGECMTVRAARNLPGVDIVQVSRLNAELLAPGSVPGRAALFSRAAIEKLTKENLFRR